MAEMSRAQRAAQIWSVLALCASQRQTLTYDLLGRLIGVPRQGLGHLLEPIQSLCVLRGVPLLTSIVVGEHNGRPSEGFLSDVDVPRAQQKVFRHDWAPKPEGAPSVTVDELAEAVKNLPTAGRSLPDLLASLD